MECVVPYSGRSQFVADKKTAIQAYSFNEPFLAEEQRCPGPLSHAFCDWFNPYASCLIATETTITSKSDIVDRMVAASQRVGEYGQPAKRTVVF